MFKDGISLRRLRKKNKHAILQVIRECGPVSRIELGKILGLSNSTCMTLTRELVSLGLVCEKGTDNSSGGRRPVLLGINPDYRYVIGFSLSSSGISCGIYNLHLKKIKMINQTGTSKEKDTIVVIQNSIGRILKESGLTVDNIAGMTLEVAGLVDTTKRDIIGSTNYHVKEIIHIRDQLNNIFPFPVYLENNGNLIALAEKKLFYPNYESLALLLVAEGIGGGIIKNNTVLQGSYGYGGEFGHISIDRNGPLCFCGNRGCIEVMGSIPVLLKKTAKELRLRKHSRIRDYMEDGVVTMKALTKAFHEKDPLAKKLFEEEADILYHAVNNIILTIDPEVIVLSGDIVLFGQVLIDRIKEKIGKTLFGAAPSSGRVIVFTQLKNPRVSGAGLYAIESFFANLLRETNEIVPVDLLQG